MQQASLKIQYPTLSVLHIKIIYLKFIKFCFFSYNEIVKRESK